MMFLRVPPLQTLVAFVTAAKYSSYSRAATELALTHSAISHQIKALEERVGYRVFERFGNRMQLTDAGRTLLAQVEHGLSAVDRAFAVGNMPRNEAARLLLTVSAVPSFASRWLAPRLARFTAAHPDIDVHLIATQSYANLKDDGIDVAIRYGTGGWADLAQTQLFSETVFPVIKPGLIDRRRTPLSTIMQSIPLIRNTREPWLPWFTAARLAMVEPASGPCFSDVGLALDAAIRGEGIALARRSLVADDLDRRQLARLSNVETSDLRAYWVLWRPSGHNARAVEMFVTWLKFECAV
jgi:LysR family transcriptional regulator, glycine cleavage system transcriptional activator